MRHSISPADKAKADERRQRFRALCKTIADMSDAERAALAANVVGIATCEGRALSFHNTCLIASQNPTATVVGGFRQWIGQGRAVRKGEHGLMIWVPISRKADPEAVAAAGLNSANQPDETRFVMATVFDVAQTQEIETGA